MMRLYSKISGCTIVFVHYRTEAYPAPLADGIRVLKHIYETTTEEIPIGVAGDSAGGCIAAALSLWARDNGAKLQAQMLIYPVLDLNMSSDSMKEFTDSPIWNAKVNEAMWQWYTKDCDLEFPQYISPMLETNFEGLPPTMIEAEQYDCLRDEDIAYGQKLFDAGVDVHTYLNKGLFHGFEACFNDQTKAIIEKRALRLKEMMEPKIQEEIIVIEENEPKKKMESNFHLFSCPDNFLVFNVIDRRQSKKIIALAANVGMAFLESFFDTDPYTDDLGATLFDELFHSLERFAICQEIIDK